MKSQITWICVCTLGTLGACGNGSATRASSSGASSGSPASAVDASTDSSAAAANSASGSTTTPLDASAASTQTGGAAGGGAAGVGAGAAGTGAGGGGGASGRGGASGSGAGTEHGGEAGSEQPPAAFTCSLVLGVSPTGQWFDSGFLSLVDASRWESIWVAHHYTNFWANPKDSGWSTAFDPYPGPAHACANGATSPDRAVFVAVNWSYTTAAEWQADLEKIVQNLRAKYPTLRRIELMTLTRAPGNVVCVSGGSSKETIIAAWTDAAIAATAQKYPGLVVQAPRFEVPSCSDFVQNGLMPQYTDAGARDVAQLIGSYYAAHP